MSLLCAQIDPQYAYESYARISYDAIEQRIAIFEEYDVKEERKYENKILLFKQVNKTVSSMKISKL